MRETLTARPFRHLAVLLAALLVPAAALLAATDVPFLVGHVNDYAHMLDSATHDRIESELAAFEKATGAQVAVLTVDSLDGEPLEDYSMHVAETWKLGRKGVDDGVLMLIAKNDHKMRIEVGYGLEGKLPDAIASRILTNIVRPSFRDGDFNGGIEKGVDAIVGTIEGKSVVPAEAPTSRNDFKNAPLVARLLMGLIFTVVVGVFSVIAVFGKGCQSWFLYLFLTPFWATFPIVIIGPAAVVLVILWLIGFPIAKLWFSRSSTGKVFLSSHPGWTSFATSSGGSGGGWSSGGGGGFSGGGGSFGGGGASSSW